MDCTGKMMKWIPMLLAPVDVIHASLSRYLFLAHNRVLFHVLRRIIALHHECTCLSTAPTAPLPQCCTQGASATALHPRRTCHSAAPKARLPQYCTAGAPASALHRRCTCLRIARAVYLLERGSQGLECCSSNSPVLVRGRGAREAAHSSFSSLSMRLTFVLIPGVRPIRLQSRRGVERSRGADRPLAPFRPASSIRGRRWCQQRGQSAILAVLTACCGFGLFTVIEYLLLTS